MVHITHTISYEEFCNNKHQLKEYINNLLKNFKNIYLPKCLNSKERRLIYLNSSNYLFEKMKDSSNFCLKIIRKNEESDYISDGEESDYISDGEESEKEHYLEKLELLDNQINELTSIINDYINNDEWYIKLNNIFTSCLLFSNIILLYFTLKDRGFFNEIPNLVCSEQSYILMNF